MTETTPSPLSNVITIDDERIKNHLDRAAPEGSEASGADLRDGDHRALPAARERGGGSIGRDVSGRRLGTAGRRHHGGSVGHAGFAFDRVGPEQEDLRNHRGLA